MGFAHVLPDLLQRAVRHDDSDCAGELGVQLLVVSAERTDLLHDLFNRAQSVVLSEIRQSGPDETMCASSDAFAPRWLLRRRGTSIGVAAR